MSQKLYATFAERGQAEKAVGALLDNGAVKDDVTIVVDKANQNGDLWNGQGIDHAAKEGITTTTADDAGSGAISGAEVGLGVGILAGLASIFVPGIGLVVGSGALAMAATGALATTAAGAMAGGVVGYLKDQGLPEHAAYGYADEINTGGALIELILPSGRVDEVTGMALIAKYGGTNAMLY